VDSEVEVGILEDGIDGEGGMGIMDTSSRGIASGYLRCVERERSVA